VRDTGSSHSSSRRMPHFICRWPGGDVLLASVESRQELDAILQVGLAVGTPTQGSCTNIMQGSIVPGCCYQTGLIG